jgi:CHASE2 domain-containing sensor protein/signal transduction histidine kinase
MNPTLPFRARPWWTSYFTLALTCFVTTLAVGDLSTVREFSDRLNDGLFRLRNLNTGSSSVVLVVIDDASLAQEGRWPWHRAKLGRLIDAVSASGPRGIGLDILLSEPSDEGGDDMLAKALTHARNVVLAAKLSTAATGPLWVEPLPMFAHAAAAVGHVQASLDGDGVCRRLPDEEMSVHGVVPMMARALVAASYHTRYPNTESATIKFLAPSERTIDYRGLDDGSAGSRPFETISAATLLHGSRHSFSQRIVLIGFAGTGLEDELLTPLNYRSPAAGVLIQANMADTLDRARYITRVSPLIQLPLLMVVCLCGGVVVQAHKAARTAVWILGAPSCTYLFGCLGFVIWGFHFHLGLALLAELLVVPLGQLQHILVLQTLIGGSLIHLKKQTQDLPLHIAGLLEHDASWQNPSKFPHTNAEWKLKLIARTEQQITILSAFQQTLLDAMRDGIAVFGGNGLLMFKNPTFSRFLALCRWSEESCWSELRFALHSEDTEAQNGYGKDKPRAVQAMGKEVLIGEKLWRVSLVRLPAVASGHRTLYMALCADLTPQMERDQARQQALQFITHELRTPLVSLQGFAELLQKFPERAAAAGAAEIIFRESDRLVALTSMYLECLRLETTLPVVSPGLTNAENLMNRAASVAQPLCAASNKRLVLSLPEDRIELYLDVPMVTGALLNLIANAVKYGAEGTDVKARVEVREEVTILSVCNEGNRIPRDELGRLFAPQYRILKSAQCKTGWGIGLAFVKRVMDAHGGEVLVRSDEVETCFQLLFPFHRSREARSI